MVLDHAKFDAMMQGFCGWLPGCCYAVAGVFRMVARWLLGCCWVIRPNSKEILTAGKKTPKKQKIGPIYHEAGLGQLSMFRFSLCQT